MNNSIVKNLELVLNHSQKIIYSSDAERFFKNFIVTNGGVFSEKHLELKVAKDLCPYGKETVFWRYFETGRSDALILFIGATKLYRISVEGLHDLNQLIFDPKCSYFSMAIDERFELRSRLDPLNGLGIDFILDNKALEGKRIIDLREGTSWQDIEYDLWMRLKTEAKPWDPEPMELQNKAPKIYDDKVNHGGFRYPDAA